MANKTIRFFLVLTFFVAVVSLAPKPQKNMDERNDILFANPWFFRAISGNFHNLLADRLWLLSNTVGEVAAGNSFNVDADEFYAASRTITIMDPYFFPAVNYASTYLASIKNDVKRAYDLLEIAKLQDERNFHIYFSQIILLLTYQEPKKLDDDLIAKLAIKAALLPDSQKILGRIVVSDWIEELLIYARSQKGRHEQAAKDLRWLLKNTKDEAKKREIEKKLGELGG